MSKLILTIEVEIDDESLNNINEEVVKSFDKPKGDATILISKLSTILKKRKSFITDVVNYNNSFNISDVKGMKMKIPNGKTIEIKIQA